MINKNISNVRSSNFELLRIISMIFIVLYHVVLHGHVVDNAVNDSIKSIGIFIEFFCIVHVNSFVLVTGYYQSEKKFKASKIWSLITSSIFYRILILIVFSVLGITVLSNVELLMETSIFNLNQYWFIKTYMLLYCLSPFMNKLIQVLNKRDYFKLLFVLTIILSIIPFVTNNYEFSNNGYTLYSFIYLYLMGAFFKKYSINKSYIFRRCSKQLLQIILICIFVFSLLINLNLYYSALYLKDFNSVFSKMFSGYKYSLLYYSNPLVIIQSISFFLFFETLSIKSKFINKISSLTLGIYLISDNSLVRGYIYRFLMVDNGTIYSYKFYFYVLGITILIFVVCAFIEWLRQLLFKFIGNRKIMISLKDKYNNWVRGISLD